MNKKVLLLGIMVLILLALAGCGPAETDTADQADSRTLSVIFYDWIPQYEEYIATIESTYEAAYPDIDLQIIDLPGYYDELDTTVADVYEVDEGFLRMLLDADRLQPLADSEVPDPDDYLPICKDVAYIDGSWWGVPHWTCTYFMFYNKNDTELAAVDTFSELEAVIGGADHPRGEGLLINLDGNYPQYYYQDTLMELYDTQEEYYGYADADNLSAEAVDILQRIAAMMDDGMGRDPLSSKIFDNLQRQFIYGNGRAYVYYSEALGYFNDVVDEAEGFGVEHLSIDDIAIKAFVQSEDGRISQPGFVDCFCLDKSLTGQKREDAINFIHWVTSTEEVLNQLAPTPETVRYLSPARLSVYDAPELLEIAPLYAQMKPVMEYGHYIAPPADWDWAPGLNEKLDALLPVR